MKIVKPVLSALRQNKGMVLFVFLLLVFRGAIADWHPVPTGSMKPTILEGDVIWHNKLAYDLKIPFTDVAVAKLGEPSRGDIVVINSLVADKRLVKRVIGIPGDRIAVVQNQLFINGLPASYRLTNDASIVPTRKSDIEDGVYSLEVFDGMPDHVVTVKPQLANPYSHFTVQVPQGYYFAMGDNRDSSADSRVYGLFAREEIRGRATHTLLSMNILDRYIPRFERFFAQLR